MRASSRRAAVEQRLEILAVVAEGHVHEASAAAGTWKLKVG